MAGKRKDSKGRNLFTGESHDFWEMVYVDKGEIIATADDCDITLKQGEALFHKPMEFHKLRSNGVSAPNVFGMSFVCEDEDMSYFEGKHLEIPGKLRRLITDIIAESQNTYALPVFDRDLKELSMAKNPAFGGSQIIRMRLEELLIKLIREGYGVLESGSVSDLRIRKEAGLPPYMKFATALFRAKDAQLAQRWADLYSKSLAKYPGLTVSEAIPPALGRAEGWFRYQVQIRAESSKLIAAAWRWISKARPAPKELRIALDIDAVNVM